MTRWNRRLQDKRSLGALPPGYVESLEFVMKDKTQLFFNYVIVSCQEESIANPFGKDRLDRGTIATIVTIFDILICLSFAIFLLVTEYQIKKTAARHDKLTFETKEFSVMVSKLPAIDEKFNQEHLKIELWNHIEK